MDWVIESHSNPEREVEVEVVERAMPGSRTRAPFRSLTVRSFQKKSTLQVLVPKLLQRVPLKLKQQLQTGVDHAAGSEPKPDNALYHRHRE